MFLATMRWVSTEPDWRIMRTHPEAQHTISTSASGQSGVRDSWRQWKWRPPAYDNILIMYASAPCFPRSLRWLHHSCPEDVRETESERQSGKGGESANNSNPGLGGCTGSPMPCVYCMRAAVRVKQAAWCAWFRRAATFAHGRLKRARSEAHSFKHRAGNEISHKGSNAFFFFFFNIMKNERRMNNKKDEMVTKKDKQTEAEHR